ncbi:MFS transporter [uncultured Desulfosarcina sp.]|uniref:MFS transporter n=1 Tax=uncultured Desulfosarcina sp. TaxID=218289 RepID=UPI0029C7D61E|nr:MFS transporter [uncultured Desulfosarcina sp.]
MTPSGAKQRKPFWILPTIVFAQFAGTSIWFSGNAVLAELVQAGVAGSSISGWVTGAVQMGFIAGTLIFAFLSISDRFAPRVVFLLCTLAGALFNLSIVFADTNLTGLLLLRLATGFFLAGIYPVGMKIAAGWYEKGLGNALGFLIGALVLGTAFPHLLKGGFSAFSWQAVMVLSSGVCLFGGLMMALFVPDGPYLKTAPAFDPKAVMALFRCRPLRSAAFGYFGHMWELYTLWAFVPVFLSAYATQTLGAVLNVPVWSFSIIGVGCLGCIVGGIVSIRHGSALVATVQLAVSGLCCVLSPLIFALTPELFLLFMLLWGTAVVGDSPQFSAMVARSSPAELVGSALTLVNCIGFSITVVSLAVVQWLATLLPVQYLFLVLAAGPVLGLSAMLPFTANGTTTGKTLPL